LLASLLVLLWPALQIARYGIEVIYTAYIKEMVLKFIPESVVTVTQEQWWQWFIQDGAGLWIPAILSLFILPYCFRKPESFVPPFLFCCFAILMTLVIGSNNSRYVLLILPILAASLAALLARIIPVSISAVIIAGVLTLSAGDPFKSPDSLSLFKSSQNIFKPLLEKFAKSLREEEMPLLCRWSRAKSKKIHPEAFSYFASNGKLFLELDEVEDLSMKEYLLEINPPYRGLCQVNEFEELKQWLVDYKVIEQSNGYVHWTSKGTISPNK
jgi:branched-subunit amino acid transport protein